MSTITIKSLDYDKAFYKLGEALTFSLQVNCEDCVGAVPVDVVFKLSFLSAEMKQERHQVELERGLQRVRISVAMPPDAPRGYGMDVQLLGSDGQILSQISSGFDVLNYWIERPRYGFLTDFWPDRTDQELTTQRLAQFHINGLQYYDWMYRHEQLLTSEEPYIDLVGRTLSLQTVESLIEQGHKRNIAAMPYTAIYGASIDFYRANPEWVLYKKDGSPALFGDNFMAIMDPRPDSPWMEHLQGQFKEVLQRTQFDGIHLDQYGDPIVGYDKSGDAYDIAQALVDSINRTRVLVDIERTKGAVIFNAVTAWPVEQVAKSEQDVVYIELWSPFTQFNHLHQQVVDAQRFGDGKPVIIAAYVHPSGSSNPILMDAILFASGASHIEMGENLGYLADAYFPNYEALDADQFARLKRYYDFTVRYADVIGPATQDAKDLAESVEIADISTSSSANYDKVMPIARDSRGFSALNLINLVGIESPEWNKPAKYPQPLEDLQLSLAVGDRAVKQIWLASPDSLDLSLQLIPFTVSGARLHLTIPSLDCWDVVLIEWDL